MCAWQALGPRDVRRWDEDLNALADAVAESAEIFNQDGRLVWLNAGKLIPVSRIILREIITTHVVTKNLINHGTADEPNWTREYVPFVPHEQALRALLTAEARKDCSLIARAPKA
jgi:hypothetical protein